MIYERAVLLIEDNDQNAYLVKVLIEPRGYTAVHAASGHDGLELAWTLRPDLILLDIQLPMMDGYAVAWLFCEIESLPDTRIIAVTSYAMLGDREKALESSCTGYIEQPINPETFVAEIEQFVSPPSANKEQP